MSRIMFPSISLEKMFEFEEKRIRIPEAEYLIYETPDRYTIVFDRMVTAGTYEASSSTSDHIFVIVSNGTSQSASVSVYRDGTLVRSYNVTPYTYDSEIFFGAGTYRVFVTVTTSGNLLIAFDQYEHSTPSSPITHTFTAPDLPIQGSLEIKCSIDIYLWVYYGSANVYINGKFERSVSQYNGYNFTVDGLSATVSIVGDAVFYIEAKRILEYVIIEAQGIVLTSPFDADADICSETYCNFPPIHKNPVIYPYRRETGFDVVIYNIKNEKLWNFLDEIRKYIGYWR